MLGEKQEITRPMQSEGYLFIYIYLFCHVYCLFISFQLEIVYHTKSLQALICCYGGLFDAVLLGVQTIKGFLWLLTERVTSGWQLND